MSFLPKSLNIPELHYETIYETNNTVVGKCTIFKGNKFTIHYHNISEIYIILDGNGEVFNKGKWEKTKKGDIFNFPPYTQHCARTSTMLKILYIFNNGPFNQVKYFYPKL